MNVQTYQERLCDTSFVLMGNIYCGPAYTKADRCGTHLLLEIRNLQKILTYRKYKKRDIRVSVKFERFCLP
jgi:hypothetical protein